MKPPWKTHSWKANWFLTDVELDVLMGEAERLRTAGISFALLDTDNAVLLSHQPVLLSREGGKAQRAPRQGALAVRSAARALGIIRNAVHDMVVLTRFEVYASLKTGVHPSSLAAALSDLDNITVWSVKNKERVFPSQSVVEAPQLYLMYPPGVPYPDLCAYASRFGTPSSTVQAVGKSCCLLITYLHKESVALAAGSRINIGVGDSLFTTGSPNLDRDSLARLPLRLSMSLKDRVAEAKQYVSAADVALAGLGEARQVEKLLEWGAGNCPDGSSPVPPDNQGMEEDGNPNDPAKPDNAEKATHVQRPPPRPTVPGATFFPTSEGAQQASSSHVDGQSSDMQEDPVTPSKAPSRKRPASQPPSSPAPVLDLGRTDQSPR